jgi:hypothetical protein
MAGLENQPLCQASKFILQTADDADKAGKNHWPVKQRVLNGWVRPQPPANSPSIGVRLRHRRFNCPV